MSFIIKVIASNPPTVLFALGALLLIIGSTTSDPALIKWGENFFVWGIILQILWLIPRLVKIFRD